MSEKTGKPAHILTFPGVPKELYHMWPQGRDYLLSHQQTNGKKPERLVSEFMHFFGIGESKLGELLSDLMAQDNPTVAPYVGRAEVRIRIAAKAKNDEEGQAVIAPVKAEILKRCGQFYYGEGDITLEQYVASLLFKKKLTVSVAESCTGGLVSSRLTDIAGSSAYTLFNAITYSNKQKTAVLGVNPKTLLEFGAVSPQTAKEMAEGIKQESGSDIGLSLTGIAGPDGGTDTKPVGLVYIGLCDVDGNTETHKVLVNQNYSRIDIKHWFSQYALNFLRLYLLSI